VNAADIGPVPPSDRRQSALDLFLIVACANIVATTFQTGASLTPAFGLRSALTLVAIGAVAGSLLNALLSAVGPRYGAPSVIAARAALGIRGAGVVALLLYTTNFAWIAVNNVIAASACAQIAGGPASLRAWAVGLGIVSTLIVAGGPRLVAWADRLAVPLLALVGAALTVACLRVSAATVWAPGDGSLTWVGGLDVVIGYQVSWVLMFADYSRYTPSGQRAGIAVFLGLALTSLWLMPLGVVAARAAASNDPGAMLQALKLGVSGAVLMTVATVTTNFVNIYMSALALRSLMPRAGDQLTVWSTGLIAAGLSLFSGAWLDRYASLMMVLGGVLVPVGGVLLARFYLVGAAVTTESLYDRTGEHRQRQGFDPAGLVAWACGGAVYYLAGSVGRTLPALVVAVGVYLLVKKVGSRQ
jgi:cytosine permease